MSSASALSGDSPTDFELSCQLCLHECPVRVAVARDEHTLMSAGTKEEFIEWKLREDSESSAPPMTSTSASSASADADGDAVMSRVDELKDALLKARGGQEWVGRSVFSADSVLHPLTFCMIAYRSKTAVAEDLGHCYLSGGSDNRALLWNSEGHLLQELMGHSDAVNCVDMFDDAVSDEHIGVAVTGSYDGSARVWDKDGVCTAILGGHKYGVEVCCLGTGEIVTGSFHSLHFWTLKGEKLRTVTEAHNHVIRKIKRHPLGFVTCANDGFVKLWSNKGELLQSIEAHPEMGDRPSFIYGLHVSSTTGLLFSSGEDGSCRVWNSDGSMRQTLPHPGAVWAVDALPNGDIVTSCADAVVRVWSCDEARFGEASMVSQYYELLEAQLRSQLEGGSGGMAVDESQLLPVSALLDGGKPGEFKMINHPEKGPSVYQWDAAAGEWVYIGQITGRPSADGGSESAVAGGSALDSISGGGGDGMSVGGGKATLDGKQYDHVVHIDLSAYGDGTRGSQALGFNIDDDPIDIAKFWCAVKSVDLDMVPQIAAHLKPYANAEARGRRLRREAEEAAKRIKHIPSFVVCNYEINGKMQLAHMRKAIEKANAALLAENNPLAIGYVEAVSAAVSVAEPSAMDVDSGSAAVAGDEVVEDESTRAQKRAKKERNALDKLWTVLNTQSKWHAAEFPDEVISLILDKMLQWNTEDILPVLDMCRVLMLHSEGCDKLMSNPKCREAVLRTIEDCAESKPPLAMIACRLISNYLAKRNRGEAERSGSQYPTDLLGFLCEALSGLSTAASSPKRTIRTAYLMCAHNAMLWFSKFKVEESDLYLILSSALFDLTETIGAKISPKILYYVLSIVGTIAWASGNAQAEILEVYESQLQELTKLAAASSDAATKEIGMDVTRLFGL